MISVLPLRTPTLPPATHTNCWRVGRVVIDPASPWDDEQARLGEWAEGVDTVVLTHHHADHIGAAEFLRARVGARILAHRDARLPFAVDARLDDGDSVDTGEGALRALHTPGHADGHIALQLDDGGEVFAGDLVAGVGTIVLVPPEGDLANYLASLERIAAIATTLHPAHGPSVPVGVAHHYIAHRNLRTDQFRDALRGGADTAEGVAAAVYAGLPGVDLRLAALQVRTHLAWLAERGEASEAEGRWRLLA